MKLFQTKIYTSFFKYESYESHNFFTDNYDNIEKSIDDLSLKYSITIFLDNAPSQKVSKTCAEN